MKRFTSEASNALEGRELIPRTFSRRQALGLLGGSLAGVSLLSLGLAVPAKATIPAIAHNEIITLECLGDKAGPRYLDGRTHNGTVGLAPHTNPPYTGTRWRVEYLDPSAGPDQPWIYNHIYLYCEGTGPGDARHLDGRTQDGTVGLAPHRSEPFTGTRWHLTVRDGYYLECKGKEPGSLRWLDGRTQDGTVGLAPNPNQFTGTRWSISDCFGQGCRP
jgi:hypothetical protein